MRLAKFQVSGLKGRSAAFLHEHTRLGVPFRISARSPLALGFSQVQSTYSSSSCASRVACDILRLQLLPSHLPLRTGAGAAVPGGALVLFLGTKGLVMIRSMDVVQSAADCHDRGMLAAKPDLTHFFIIGHCRTSHPEQR